MISRSTLFFFNDTATTEIYTLSLHDALPISADPRQLGARDAGVPARVAIEGQPRPEPDEVERPGREKRPADRKSTRLNSSHGYISYAVFCLQKKSAHAAPV